MTQIEKAFAYKGLTLKSQSVTLMDTTFSGTIARGMMFGVKVSIHFKDVNDAKTWFEGNYKYAVEDAAELYGED